MLTKSGKPKPPGSSTTWMITIVMSGSPRNRGGPRRHPCQKPVDITERIITTHTNPGALIVDFFAGSGAVGVAAIRNRRRFLLIDQDEKHQAAGAAWIEKEKARLCI